jgi:hypothetical protein
MNEQRLRVWEGIVANPNSSGVFPRIRIRPLADRAAGLVRRRSRSRDLLLALGDLEVALRVANGPLARVTGRCPARTPAAYRLEPGRRRRYEPRRSAARLALPLGGTPDMSTVMSSRTIRRTAITIPAELLSDVDRAARDLGESRSGYITRILSLAVRARRNAAITRRLDELFADASVAAEQRRSAAELDAAGFDWNNERW